MRYFPMLLFFLSLLSNSFAEAARPSEVISGVRSGSSSKGDGECKSPFCLPGNIVDDDPTLGAKLPDCGLLGSMMSPSRNQVASSEANGDGLQCSSSQYAKPTNEEKAQQARLYKCLEQVREILPKDYQAQKKFISDMQSARLKTFLGMVLTTYGEASGEMDVGDHLAIMKVLDNRTRTCVTGDKPEATTWEIATSPNQFSMYNANLYGGSDKDFHIKNKEKNGERMKLAIEAFGKLQCAKLEPAADWEKAEHYKADYVSPEWAKGKDLIVSAKVNGDPIASKKPYHMFYRLPWSCVIASNKPRGGKKNAKVQSQHSPFEWMTFVSSVAHATDKQSWEMANFGARGVYLRMKNRTLTQIKVHSDPLGARLISVVPHKRHGAIDVIQYDSGEHGTNQIVRVYRAVLFDTRSATILGDFPLRYVGKGAKVQPQQPAWTDSDSGISIFDPETGTTDEIEVGK